MAMNNIACSSGPGMNKATVVLFCLLMSMLWLDPARAQNKTQDAVYLHNGSMVRGQIIERIENDHVKIETVDGCIWVFPMSDVREIATVDQQRSRKDFEYQQKGFYNLTDAGILTGKTKTQSVHSLSVQSVSGYQISKHFAAGVGVGFEKFDIALAPVFGEGRYYVLKGRFSPFIALQGGYGIPLENYRDQENEWINKGGLMANANVGIRNYINSNIGFVVSAGFRHQQSISKQDWWWFSENDYSSIVHQYNRFVFRIGFLFN